MAANEGRSRKDGIFYMAKSNRSGVWQRTMVIVGFVLVLGFGAVITNLVRLQLVNGETLKTDAVDQSLQSTQLTPSRGTIYDATGTKVLAQSASVWTVALEPNYIDEGDDVKIAKGLSEILGLDYDAVLKKAQQNSYFVYVKRKVETEVRDEIVQYIKDEKIGRGITLMEDYKRYYPYGTTASTVLGFTGTDNQGLAGVETEYDSELTGTAGRLVSAKNAQGDDMPFQYDQYVQAQDGYDLVLTIDETVQSIVEKHLQAGLEACGALEGGTAVLMNVKTGAILAMASLEQFDPNDPMFIYDDKMQTILDKTDALTADDIDWLEGRLGEKNVASIIADSVISQETTEDENGNTISSEYTQLQGMLREAQWKNKNITELYMPGSIFKLITASAGLDSGIMNMNQTFYCNGELTVNQGSELWEHTYHCANGEVHTLQNMAQALDNSCNLWFIQAAQTLQPTVFYDYIRAFGFTQPTGVDLPSETRWTSVYNAQQMAEVDTNLYTAAFGQNEAITPMQMATAIAAIANGGYLVTPYIVDSITDDAGNIISQTDTSVRRQVISEEVSQEILSMMENNVDPNGTLSIRHSCKNAYVAGYRIGGKSGTAERTDRHLRGDGDYYKAMSFSAVLPINDPEIEVFVLLDDPRWIHDYASQVVAPVVGNIISEVAPYLGIEQDANYNPTGNVTVQTCLDYTWTNAQVTLNQLGLQHKLIGSNGNIVYQYPVGGSSVPVGSTIYLYTNTDQDAMTTVPDVTGKSGSFASQMLKASNLNVQFEGDSSGRVVSQSTAAETSAAYGTIVTLTMESDGSEDTAEIPAEETPAEETPAEETQEQ